MIEGKSVYLRAIEESDLAQLMSWRNNPEFRQFFRETAEINTNRQAQWFDMINRSDSPHVMFSIVNNESNELLGACGLCYIDLINRSADFSIYIGFDNLYIDRLFAVDAANLLMRYGFDVMNLHRLWAEIYSIDDKKNTFFQAIGFKQDAVFRETYWHRGKWHDSIFYSILESDDRMAEDSSERNVNKTKHIEDRMV